MDLRTNVYIYFYLKKKKNLVKVLKNMQMSMAVSKITFANTNTKFR